MLITQYLRDFLKGIVIGAANIIPGVSGGTIALITGIFEALVDSIKSLNFHALHLLLKGKLREFLEYTNFLFLFTVFFGAACGIYVLAFVLEPLFTNYPQYVWAFFFGLILASVFFVSKSIYHWNLSVVALFIAGTVIAILITVMLDPASENSSAMYLFICGIVAICSMILPGLSGSYVLLLMGNYELVMIYSVKSMDMAILLPVLAGAVFGIIAFSHLLSWVFKKFRDHTIALLNGFIFGSLGILWPWKNEVIQAFGEETEKVIGYEWYLPYSFNTEVVISLLLMITGILAIWGIEKKAGTTK